MTDYPVVSEFTEPLQIEYAKLNKRSQSAAVAQARRRPSPMRANRTKISRNSPCPCGAQRKFKYCCLPLTKVISDVETANEPAAPAAEPNPQVPV